jgi:hypothetical protein
MTTPTPIDPKRLKTFKTLAAWPDNSSSSVPMMFLMAESFKLVMQVCSSRLQQKQKQQQQKQPVDCRDAMQLWQSSRPGDIE